MSEQSNLWLTIKHVQRVLGYPFRYLASRHHHFPHSIHHDWRSINYNRISVINFLLSKNPDGEYLEIGCAQNEAFDSIISSNKTGVDPVSGGTHRMTSDDFFKQTSRSYDVIFIDGLHTYPQARQDVRNAVKHLKQGGWIVLHDLFPRNWREEHVPRAWPNWTGDVWKIAFELTAAEGLDFIVIAIDHGVGVIHYKGEATIPDLSAQLEAERFAYFYKHHEELPVLNYPEARRWMVDRLK